jgi:hypothetical protein
MAAKVITISEPQITSLKVPMMASVEHVGYIATVLGGKS